MIAYKHKSFRSGEVAQLVEQRTENPCVRGSIPFLATIFIRQAWQPKLPRIGRCMKAPQDRSIAPLVREAQRVLTAADLCQTGTRIVVAVSGGADSMALLHVLATYLPKFDLIVAHLNHGIRDTSAADAAFVQQHGKQWGIPVICDTINVPEAAQNAGLSLEMQARDMRYAFFRKVYAQHQAAALLTAHTRNDQAETVLLNLCRGCGPDALAGIPASQTRDHMHIIRPFLHIERQQILAYLKRLHIPWREDPSNQDRTYRRNAVRHNILPQLQGLNPKSIQAIAATADRAREDQALLQALAEEERSRIHPPEQPDRVLLAPYRELPAALRRRILFAWLTAPGVLPYASIRADILARIDAMAVSGQAGARITLGETHQVCHCYDHLTLCTASERVQVCPQPLRMPGTTRIENLACQVVIQPCTGYRKAPALPIGHLPASAYIRRPKTGLILRTRQPGDRIHMLGAPGNRKLQDILTDAKIPRHKRDTIPILATTDGDIIWFPGGRPAQAWAVEAPDAPALHITIAPTQ